jgi:hypothetical protein
MFYDIKTKIRPGGLRYESKESGSSFPGSFAASMSCYVCGRHQPRSQMRSFSVAGTRQFRCKEPCRHAHAAANDDAGSPP